MAKSRLLACLVLVISLCASLAFSETAELKLGAPAEAKPGEQFVLSVTGSVANLAGYQIRVLFFHDTFPSNALKVLGSSEGKLFGSADAISGDTPNGRFSMLTSGTVSGEGELASFLLASDEESSGEFYIAISAILVGEDGAIIPCDSAPVAVRIGVTKEITSPPSKDDVDAAFNSGAATLDGECTRIYCDVNLDDLVNIVDIITVRQYLYLEADGASRFYDMNVDGIIDLRDAEIVADNLGAEDAYAVGEDDWEGIGVNGYPRYDRATDAWPLVITCAVKTETGATKPIPGGLEWKAYGGAVVIASGGDYRTGICSAEVIVTSVAPFWYFTIEVEYRGCAIGSAIVYTDDSGHYSEGLLLMGTGGSEYIDIVSQKVDVNDEYYWGVFGLPDEDVAATVSLVHEDVEDATITIVGAGVTIYHDEENITGNTYEHVDYPWSLDVIVKLPSTPTPNVGQFSFSTPMSDKHEHTEEDEVRYSVCELADTTPDPKYIPYNDTFDENGKPEQYRAVTLRVNPHNPPITTIEMEADFAILNGKWEEMSSSAGYSPLVLNCYGSAGSAVIGDADLYAYQYTPYGGPYITSIHSSYTIIQPDIDIEDCPEADEWTKGQGLQLNNDDDNGDQIPDNEDNYVNGPDDRLDMLTVEIDLQPRDQNLGGSLKLVKKGGGKIRIFDYEYETLIMGPYDTEIDAWWLVFWDIRTLLVEGVEDGGDVELRLEYTNGAFSAFDRVKLRMGCDLDIDSDNNNAYSSPGRTGHEDEIEDVSGSIEDKPGKIIVVNDGDHDDTDLDGIPDGDGIRDDLDGYGTGDAYKCSGLKFVPLIFSFRRPTDPNFNLNNVRVRVTYDTCSLFADPPDGNLRIWKQQGDVHRDSRTADNGGHFVPGNPNTYTASQLGINATTLKTTLYVEALQPSLVLADEGHRITFELDVENDETFELSDSVRITAAQLSITKAKGLYKNDGSYEEGYLSEDNEGRVYCNSVYDPDTYEPGWSRNNQFVDFTVEVKPSALSPSYTKIAWKSHDPDDPSNEAAGISEEAQRILDENDYDGVDNDGDGTADNSDGADNTGGRDGWPEWEAYEPYYITDDGSSIDENGETVVRFNVTDDGGDNFIVRTGLRINDQYPMEGPRTGVMTVWKRILVQKGIMEDVPPEKQINNQEVVERFKIAFAEMVFDHAEAPQIVTTKQDPMGSTDEEANDNLHDYCGGPPGGQFRDEAPGVMFLVAGHRKTPSGFADAEVLYPEPTETGDDNNQCYHWSFFQRYISDGNAGETRYARIFDDTIRTHIEIYEGKDPETGQLVNLIASGSQPISEEDQLIRLAPSGESGCGGSVIVRYEQPDDEIQIVLRERAQATVSEGYEAWAGGPVWPVYSCAAPLKNMEGIAASSVTIFQSETSSKSTWRRVLKTGEIPDDEVLPLAFDYSLADPNSLDWKTLYDYFGEGTSQYIAVHSAGAVVSAGTADHVYVGSSLKFTGRCAIWTTFFGSGSIARTVAHEFTHSLGIAHNCGYEAYGDEKPCAMTYSSHWLRNSDGTLVPWSNATPGGALCARHVRIIRETHLEEEGPGLKLGW